MINQEVSEINNFQLKNIPDSLSESINNKTLDQYRQEWIMYLSGTAADVGSLSKTDRKRFDWTEWMHLKKHQENRTLFHMTVTYKPFKDIVYSEKIVNDFFINFYVKNFLPYLLNTRNIHTNAKKSIQPITLAFVDEHESKLIPGTHKFSEKLHHHAILAVHPDHLEKMNNLIGEDTFADPIFSSKIMTSDLKECETKALLYASKMLREYPEHLLFPDKFHRVHH